MDKIEINIGLFGAVSVGKSTFLNAIAGQQFSDTEIKKTTMIPQVYCQNDNIMSNAQIIRRQNREINESIMEAIDFNKFTVNQCQPIYHDIDRICDLFDPKIIDPNLKINIYDIPGLNDSASKNIYFEWVKQNINLFDIIIFMTDINHGLNNSDEIEILDLLMDSMKKYKIKMICLMNKCDDIYFDKKQNDLIFEEKEQENIYLQANNLMADIAKKYGFDNDNKPFTPFFPISSENCFIYRALMKNPLQKLDQTYQNRLCKNECGPNQWKKMGNEEKDVMFEKILSELKESYNNKILDTGYIAVKEIIQNTITDNKLEFVMNHIETDLKNLDASTIENILGYTKLINSYIFRIEQIKILGGNVSYDAFWKHIESSINNYTNNILKINTKILKNKDFINFEDFETIHSMMQVHLMNLSAFVDTIKEIPLYPKEFIESREKEIIDKLLNIYDQFCNIEIIEQIHVRPSNLLYYLQTINTYAPNNFNTYAKIFMEFFCNTKCKHNILYPDELANLLVYIFSNINENINSYYIILAKILMNKQQYICSKQPEIYFQYLIQTKKIIKNIKIFMQENIYSPIDILYEVTKKNISVYLGMNSLTNIYKQDIDYNKVDGLLTNFTDNDINLDFEKRLYKLFADRIIMKKIE